MVNRKRHVDERGFSNRFTVVERFSHGQTFSIGFNQVGHLQKEVGAFSRSGLRPGRERSTCGFDGAINIGRRRIGTVGQLFARGGIERFKRFATFGRYPFTINQQVVLSINVRHFQCSHRKVYLCELYEQSGFSRDLQCSWLAIKFNIGRRKSLVIG